MPEPETAFLVNAYDDPIQLIIKGRACFQNARPVSQFFDRMLAQGHRDFVVDFESCTSMDSTFLGILAGAGIRLMEGSEPGRMLLTRLSERNRELVENLGLDQIVELEKEGKGDGGEPLDGSDGPSGSEPTGPKPTPGGASTEKLEESEKLSAEENARMVLKAHENLVEIDPANLSKFQDVIQFLRNQVEE